MPGFVGGVGNGISFHFADYAQGERLVPVWMTKDLLLGCDNKVVRRFQSFLLSQVRHSSMLNDLEFAYAPVRDRVRDLREYL
jgi:hypothetical protein